MLDLISFLSFVFIMTFTPGPNNIMSMLNAGRYGIKKAIKFNLGIFLGFAIVMLLCAAFGATLVKYLPSIKPYLIFVGATYILYIAYKTLKSDYKVDNNQEKSVYGIKDGFVLQFVNPKVILYGITTMSTFILPHYSSFLILMLFAIALAIVAFIATFSWALFGSVFHKLLQKHTKAVNIILALFLVYTAVSLFF